MLDIPTPSLSRSTLQARNAVGYHVGNCQKGLGKVQVPRQEPSFGFNVGSQQYGFGSVLLPEPLQQLKSGQAAGFGNMLSPKGLLFQEVSRFLGT